MTTEPYDPQADPDADPESLNPRTGETDGLSDVDDPDADPDSLNPREQGARDEPQVGDDPTGLDD